MIYTPAEDSILMEKAVRKIARGKRVLDMGTGSGVQAVAARESGASEVVAVDIDAECVAHVRSLGFEAVKSNLFSRVRGKFDLIVFNPPYLPADAREDAESARITSGGKRGDEVILRFLKKAPEHLLPGGIILLLVSSLTPLGRIEKSLEEERLVKKVVAAEKFFMERLEVWELKRKG